MGRSSLAPDCLAFHHPRGHPRHAARAGSQVPAAVRLVGGPSAKAGFLEVQLSPDGLWGAACGDAYGHQVARVVCRQLGFKGGLQRSGYELELLEVEAPTNGSAPLLADLRCTGGEASLSQCHLGATPVPRPCSTADHRLYVECEWCLQTLQAGGTAARAPLQPLYGCTRRAAEPTLARTHMRTRPPTCRPALRRQQPHHHGGAPGGRRLAAPGPDRGAAGWRRPLGRLLHDGPRRLRVNGGHGQPNVQDAGLWQRQRSDRHRGRQPTAVLGRALQGWPADLRRQRAGPVRVPAHAARL